MGYHVFVGGIGRRLMDSCPIVGVNFTGAIVIARAGVNLRGIKVSSPQHLPNILPYYPAFQIKGAEELGAVGCLIYTDPRDDGSVSVENGYKP